MFAIDKDFDKKPIPFADIDIETLKKDYDVADDSIFGGESSLIRNWSAEDFEEFLETGTYPTRGGNEEEEEEEEVKPRKRTSKHGF